MIILHSRHSAESKAFVAKFAEDNTVIDWYDNPEGQLQYLLSGQPQPSGFPFVVHQGRGFLHPESPQWVEDEVAGKHLTEQQQLDALTLVPKLTIRRALRAMGQEAELDMILQVPEFRKDWDDAAEIDLSEDMVKDALKQMSIDLDDVKRKILGLGE